MNWNPKDKLFVNPYGWNSKPSRKDEVVYLRKDAVLEWAKEANDSGPIKDSANKGDAWSIGYLCGMKDIIDKLNSL